MKTPVVIAHRGAAGEAPENTLAAFKLALEQGCDAIELDIHMSADGQLVVCHDDDIRRTTTGEGLIGEMIVSELKRFDAGLKFHEKYAGEKIPLLEEVFDLVPEHMMINIEIKNIPMYYPKIDQKLLDLMIRRNRMHNVIISSFDHRILRKIKERNPDVKVGLLYHARLAHHRIYAESVGIPVYSIHPNFETLDREDVQDATRHGLTVYPFTVNREEDMRTLVDWGISGIITDYPGRLRSLLNNTGLRQYTE